jgi:hypothetical protein
MCHLSASEVIVNSLAQRWIRLNGEVIHRRVIAAVALVALRPATAALRPLVALGMVVSVLGALVVHEHQRYAAAGEELMRVLR